MKKFFTIAVVIATLLVFGAGTGLAWNLTPNNRAFLAADDRGDLLYNQFYLAVDGGWSTDLWVANMMVNTATQVGRSIVAKLTVQSGVLSQDIRDVNIYLTPGDVCRFRLYLNAADGLVYLYSEDGSVRNNTNTAFASAADPLNVALVTPLTACGDTAQYGYVVIQEIANSAIVVGTTNLGLMTPSGANSPARVRTTYMLDNGAGAFWNYGAAAAWDGNWLTGYTEIRNTTIGLTSGATTMLAVADYRNLIYQFETQIVRVGGGNGRNTLAEVEAILATLRTDMPFVNNATDGVSLITHTFPTKYGRAWVNAATCVPVGGAAPSEFFNENAPTGRIAHMRYAVDMNENLRVSGFSPNLVFADEVNGVFTDAAHDPVLFSATMDQGYMITNFDQLANFITQGCRQGYAADTAAAGDLCPNDVAGAGWPQLCADVTGVLPPVYVATAAVVPAGYAFATPVMWETANRAGGANSALYTSVAWPAWVVTQWDMTQYFYGLAFNGVPVIPAELRFGGQSFSLLACSRTQGVIATTTNNPGGTPTGLVDVVGSNVASGA